MEFYLDHTIGAHDSDISRLLLLVDLETLVSVSENQIRFWDLLNRREIRTVEVDQIEKIVQFNIQGVVVLSRNRLKYIGIKETEIEKKEELKGVKEMCIDREGRIVIVNSEGNVHFYI